MKILQAQTPKVTVDVNLEEDMGLLNKFKKFVSKTDNCIGLAANQLEHNNERLNKNLFAIKSQDGVKLFINPKITKYNGDKATLVEYCLSHVGKRVIAKRHNSVEVTYTTIVKNDLNKEEFKQETETLNNRFAQVFQHEYDHLQGIEEVFEYEKKQKRNEKCNCGSGKKFKKCCELS